MGKTRLHVCVALGSMGLLLATGCARRGTEASADAGAELRTDRTGAVDWSTIAPARRLTDSSADQAAPGFSPDGSKVVYQSNSDGNWELYELDLADGRPRRLTDTPEAEEDPSYSHDGRWILCTVHEPSLHESPPRDVLLMAADGSERRVIARSGADDWNPRFSADDRFVYFASDRDDERGEALDENRLSAIYRYDLLDEALTRLTFEGDVSSPCPLADGGLALRSGPGRIEVLQADGSRQTLLDRTDWILGQPTRQELAGWFFAGQRGEVESRLLHLSLTGGDPAELPLEGRGADRQPALSPDGSRLAFAGRLNGQWDLFLRDLPTSPTPAR